MESAALYAFLIFLFSACCVQCIGLAIFYPRVAANSSFNRRFRAISATAKLQRDESSRKRSVEDTLREGEEKLRLTARPSLSARLRQAKLNWSRTTYYLVCLACAVAVFLLILIATGLGKLPALGFGLSGGLLLPHWYVSFRRRRRFKSFTLEFANAVDVVVRGVKVGLPLANCFKIIAAEAHGPVKDEFKIIVEDQTLGMPLADAVERLPDRILTPEARFFAIVVAIQSRTGGSLSEALENLSKVLRDRHKMQSKIKALSSESKTSAIIIGLIPVLVAGALYLTSPKYIGLLFTTQTGRFVLVACAVWMLIGSLVMRKMIKLDV